MAARWVGLWVLFLAMVTVVEMEEMWGVALELKSETLMEEEMGVSKELPYRIIFSELVSFGNSLLDTRLLFCSSRARAAGCSPSYEAPEKEAGLWCGCGSGINSATTINISYARLFTGLQRHATQKQKQIDEPS